MLVVMMLGMCVLGAAFGELRSTGWSDPGRRRARVADDADAAGDAGRDALPQGVQPAASQGRAPASQACSRTSLEGAPRHQIESVGARLTLKAKGVYRITMVRQEPDDHHLKLTVK
jgi:hypothetical protein